MKMNKNLSVYAPAVLRIGLSLIFLWFGLNQLFLPEMFVGYVPQQVAMPMHQFMQSHHMMLVYSIEQASLRLISLNGIFEILFGVFLMLGIFTRVSALVLVVHLLGIASSLGYNDVMIRDLGLSIALVAVFLNGPDQWTLDKWKLRKSKSE